MASFIPVVIRSKVVTVVLVGAMAALVLKIGVLGFLRVPRLRVELVVLSVMRTGGAP